MAESLVTDPVSQPEAASQSTILTRLRLETRGEHEAVEQVLDLMSASLTPERYRRRLEQFYGFYAPLEKAVQAYALALPPTMRAALAERLSKTALLQQDLQYLGTQAKTLPICRNLPPLGTQAEVLGCVYVMEGATLGGRMITQHVSSALGITPTTGGRFFEGYGDNTGRMWQSMRQLLVSGSPDTKTEDNIVNNAIATFANLRDWCESLQQQPENGNTRYA